MYKAILFDLDGTLTESGEGITKCVQYALEKLGRPESDLEKLKVFIGPPHNIPVWKMQLPEGISFSLIPEASFPPPGMDDSQIFQS